MNVTNSLSNERQLRLNSNTTDDLLKKLATARRINSAADDAAGLQIANRLSSGVSSAEQGVRNIYDGISLSYVADQGLQGISDNLNELDRLAVQAGNGLLTAGDRAALQKQANQYVASIQNQIKNTEFGGVKLFAQNGDLSFNTGAGSASVETRDLAKQFSDSKALSIDFSSAESAANSLKNLRSAATQVDDLRTTVGATINSLGSTANVQNNQIENQQAALSRIQDLDYAKAVTEQTAAAVREQAGYSVAAQSRVSQQQALTLLG